MKTFYQNAKVYTGELPLQEAFLVEDGHFVCAGTREELAAQLAPEDEAVDLGGHFVCAGFNDSHMHLLSFGSTLQQAMLADHTGSLAEILSYLRDFAEAHPETAWIQGRGWNQDFFADVDRMPDRYDLDQVSEDRPICVVRACGHCLVVNSKALELLGVTVDTPQPEGGEIGITDGKLNGRFFDNAMGAVYHAMAAPGKEEVKAMIRTACRTLNSYGITSCQSDDYCCFLNLPWQIVNEAYEELEAAGELTVRVYEQANLFTLDNLQSFIKAGFNTGVGSDFYKIGPLKMLGDGALGARTAYLSIPYADDPTTRGLPVFSQQEFDDMIGYAHEHGMQVAVHAIGDACLDMVLDAYEKALTAHPRADHRHGIVHCQITRADQLERIARLGLLVYAQTIFLDYDTHIVEARAGAGLASTSYRWKTLMQTGVSVSNGSDCPVERPFVMGGIQCAVTRKSLRDLPDHPAIVYHPEEAFTVQEALDSFTSRSAYSSFSEEQKGCIRPGYLADFVVLERDPFDVPAEELKEIRILGTYLGGRQVYEG